MTIAVGQRQYLALSGRFANGKLASTTLLATTVYYSRTPRIALTSGGAVIGQAPGSTRIVAQLGLISAFVDVHVTPSVTAVVSLALPAPVQAGFVPAPQQPAFNTPVVVAAKPTAPQPVAPKPAPAPLPAPKPTYATVAVGTTYTVSVGGSGFSRSGSWSSFSSNNGPALHQDQAQRLREGTHCKRLLDRDGPPDGGQLARRGRHPGLLRRQSRRLGRLQRGPDDLSLRQPVQLRRDLGRPGHRPSGDWRPGHAVQHQRPER